MNSNTLNIASFKIRTPADGGDYHLLLGGKEVTAQTLKFGVVKLFNELGIIPSGTQGVEPQLIGVIKEYPDSREKLLLLTILDNSRFNNLPPILPEPPQDEQKPQNTPPEVILEESSVLAIVTANNPIKPPVKPPYRRHGQSTIFDVNINQAIKNTFTNGKTAHERSLRTIACLLQSQGIKVSHMTISRRIKELKRGQVK